MVTSNELHEHGKQVRETMRQVYSEEIAETRKRFNGYLEEAAARAEAAEAKVARAMGALLPLIEHIEGDDSGEPVCHDYDRIDGGECALVADLKRVRAALDGAE